VQRVVAQFAGVSSQGLRARVGVLAGLVACGAGLVSAAPLGSLNAFLAGALEESFQRAEVGDAATIAGVIALGGGIARIREAGRLARLYPHLRVLVSGAGDDTYVLGLLGEGIDRARVLVETRARTTHENATLSAAALAPKPGERWLLVTSASHMPRAIGAFRRNAVAVEPWPVYDLAPRNHAVVARHEWLGLMAYWMLGRTSALLPAPAPPRKPRQHA
jgi:uncharacterized SAM-binding protein YcdF (DUF218 family)